VKGMNETNNGRVVRVTFSVLVLFAGSAAAGDFQLGLRVGRNGIDVDGARLSTGNSVSDHMVNLGVAASYSWTRGGFVEAGASGYRTVDLFGVRDLDHYWVGGGWTFDLHDHWQMTPKCGLAYSKLTTSDGNLFATEPVDELTDMVPFVELTLERRFRRHVGVGLYFRHTFEEWGRTRDLGLTVSWRFR
jgi:hypothetical protein